MDPSLHIDQEGLAEFCRRWKIVDFALFGSVLREDFKETSDVDVLVRFAPEARWTVLDFIHAERELSDLIGRKVDLVEREAVERSANWIRRKAILGSAKTIYASR